MCNLLLWLVEIRFIWCEDSVNHDGWIKDRREKGWRRGQSVDIHILASRRNVAFWEKERSSRLFPFIALLLTPSSPFPLSNSHHLFYSSFNQFHFSLSTSKCSSSGHVPMATAVARQHTTLHHPFQKSDRWRGRMPRQEWEKEEREGERVDIRKEWRRRDGWSTNPEEELHSREVEMMQPK